MRKHYKYVPYEPWGWQDSWFWSCGYYHRV